MSRSAISSVLQLFEVPPHEDEAFLAWWEGASAVLYRALRTDARFRFVSVAGPGAEAIAGLPFAAHSVACEIVHEDGEPDGTQGVTLINPFEVAEEDDERFLAGWQRVRNVLAAQRGYLGTRLHRSVGPADLRFVNCARWSSPLMFFRATQLPQFQQAAAAMPFPSHPALYLVVGGP
jgi:heme-degrading monooxygenase HmoA